ncbi:MAG: hypothetical protein M1817_003556 [Caeruleum heppii]|nr:MAG: hypothetical protein M1817_003556 [Caeruleum heppii]
MSVPQPPTLPSPTPTTTQTYKTLTHNLSLFLLCACPLLIALPPRKVDFYTFSLSAAFLVSANNLTEERTPGRGLWYRVRRPFGAGSEEEGKEGGSGLFGDGLPSERAREVQERLKREKLLRAQPGGQGSERAENVPEGVLAEVAAVERGKAASSSAGGLAERIWMGDETEGWRERRIREAREKLEEGRGYGGMIVDQIWEVWTGKKEGRDKETGEESRESKGSNS